VLSQIRFSEVAGAPLVGPSGNQVGKVVDCVVRLVDGRLPRVVGVLLRLEGRDVWVSMKDIAELSESGVRLTTDKLDTRPFERRPGEVLLDRDIVDRAVIDVEGPRLVKVRDLILERENKEWRVVAVVTAPPTTMWGALRSLLRLPEKGVEEIEWSRVEPLVGHVPTAAWRLPFQRLAELRPADIADLVEQASHGEGEEILEAVHQDKELEADVFEELDETHQVEFLRERTDAEVAEVLASMEPDAAADLLMEFDQARRRPLLDLLPREQRKHVQTLLGFHPETAGGLMSSEFVTVPESETVDEALKKVRELAEVPAIFTDVFVLDGDRLSGALPLSVLVRSDGSARIEDVMERDPVAVYADADLPSVAVQMVDYNLATLPVVDEEGHLIGIITHDDLLEAILPEEWRWRGRGEQARVVEPAPESAR
jgi:CBS domain-containing protein/sporulation protein YlmC with PRC-barrel domain